MLTEDITQLNEVLDVLERIVNLGIPENLKENLYGITLDMLKVNETGKPLTINDKRVKIGERVKKLGFKPKDKYEVAKVGSVLKELWVKEYGYDPPSCPTIYNGAIKTIYQYSEKDLPLIDRAINLVFNNDEENATVQA